MKRLLIVLAAVAALAIGSAAVVSAQTPTPFQGGNGWGCWGAGANGSYDPAANPTLQRLADRIGIGVADLVQQLKEGKSVVEVAAGKVSEEDLVNVLLQPQADMLKLRVQYGYLTQEQADAAQKQMADRVRLQLEQKGFAAGQGLGPAGGWGGMMGGGFGGHGMMGPGFGGHGMMGRGFDGSGMMGRSFGPRS